MRSANSSAFLETSTRLTTAKKIAHDSRLQTHGRGLSCVQFSSINPQRPDTYLKHYPVLMDRSGLPILV